MEIVCQRFWFGDADHCDLEESDNDYENDFAINEK